MRFHKRRDEHKTKIDGLVNKSSMDGGFASGQMNRGLEMKESVFQSGIGLSSRYGLVFKWRFS
jgi:hypothetical protein